MKVAYTKPVVSRTELVIDQAVLKGCKATLLAPGPLSGGDCEVGSGEQCLWISS